MRELPQFKVDIPPPPKPQEIKYKVKNKRTIWYILGIIIPIISIIIFIVMFILFLRHKISFIILLFYGVLGLPLFLIGSFIFWIRVFLDRKRIKGAIIKKVSKNYLKVNFWLPNNRKQSEIKVLNSDGKSLDVGDSIYIVDKERIYYDEENIPNIDYLSGIPNPIKYNFTTYIEQYNELVKDGKALNLKDYDGEEIDISYSSVNLKKFKQDKIFQELHTKSNELSLGNILLYLGLFILFILQIFILTKK